MTCRIFKYLIFIALISTYGCQNDDIAEVPSCPSDFITYVEGLGLNPTFDVIKDSLIACAGSGQMGVLNDPSNTPTSILFYPNGVVSDFRYWTLNTSIDSDPACLPFDRSMTDIELNDSPLWNGFLRKFQSNSQDELGVVSYIRNNQVFVSNPIQIKTESQPTAFNPSPINITDTNTGKRFEWEAAPEGEDAIYFHVVADLQGNLISGTYTFDRHWTFYDLSNVVLNIREIDPPPTLIEGATYQFVVMGVSLDNWVNALWDTTFVF